MSSKLCDAVLENDPAELKRLVSNGANVNEVDEDGRTALMNAVIDGRDEMVEYLIQHGANVSVRDLNGFSALHFAAQEFRLEAARLLLSAQAAVDATDKYGNTALWRAVYNSRGRGEMVHLLLKAGANSGLVNASNVSPIDLARSIANYDLKRFFE